MSEREPWVIEKCSVDRCREDTRGRLYNEYERVGAAYYCTACSAASCKRRLFCGEDGACHIRSCRKRGGRLLFKNNLPGVAVAVGTLWKDWRDENGWLLVTYRNGWSYDRYPSRGCYLDVPNVGRALF